MKKFEIQEPNLDEIMQKIRDEVAARNSLSRGEECLSCSQFVRENASAQMNRSGVFSKLLWTFGTRYASLIKKIPVIKNMAEKYYWRLANEQTDMVAGTDWINNMPPDLENVLNYRRYLEEISHQGLRGRIKLFIFKLIGFFAWWQEQINGALYREIVNQKAKIEDVYQELISQRAKIEDVRNRLTALSRTEDALYQEIINQRISFSESDRVLEKSLTWKIDQMNREIREQIGNLDIRIMELEKRLILLDEGKRGCRNQ